MLVFLVRYHFNFTPVMTKENLTEEKKVRYALRFTGRVQGVGFRYTSYNLALALSLTGWVFNDLDGSVCMQIQGKKTAIQKLIEGLENATFVSIENIEKEELSLLTDEHSFEIKEWF